MVQKCIANIWQPCWGINSICCWRNQKRSYVILTGVIKLMEDEEGKVEVDELYLGFYLIHVLYIILPCGFTKLLGVYKVGKKINK